jgi:hypothetical protein
VQSRHQYLEASATILFRRVVIKPLDAPVTSAILPSRTRWPELLPKFVEAVRVC